MENNRTYKERVIKPFNGIAALILIILLLIASIMMFIFGAVRISLESFSLGIILIISGILLTTASSISFAGLRIVKPNEALVLSLFGKYHGTIYDAGFFFVNPFSTAIYPHSRDEEVKPASVETVKGNLQVSLPKISKKVSTKLTTLANGAQKVNDKLGNPVEVSAIVVWKVVNATKAVINVDNYTEFISNQTDSTIRNVARLYPYDLMSDDDPNDEADETTLRGSAIKVAQQMKEELATRVEDAGIEIVEIRLNQIAYATEIAAAMLQKQQAVAIIAARKKIVEGAVSMVEMALDKLKEDGVVDLDEERKAQMVSNLLVVLCGNKEANPVLNTGSIY